VRRDREVYLLLDAAITGMLFSSLLMYFLILTTAATLTIATSSTPLDKKTLIIPAPDCEARRVPLCRFAAYTARTGVVDRAIQEYYIDWSITFSLGLEPEA
jgi:hypothetical protein